MSSRQTSPSGRHNTGEFAFLNIMHPAHLAYIRGFHANTLEYLFGLLDAYDADARDEILRFVYFLMTQPRFERPVTGQETMLELQVDDASYTTFKQTCFHLVATGKLHAISLTTLVASMALQNAFYYGDTTIEADRTARSRDLVEFTRVHAAQAKAIGMDEANQAAFIAYIEQHNLTLHEDLQQGYARYVTLCEQVIQPLLDEPLHTGR